MPSAKWITWGVLAALAMPATVRAGGITFCFIGLGIHDSGPESSSPQDSAASSAFAGVETARDQLHRTNIQLSRQFEQSADYQAARFDTSQAFTDYQLAKQAALAALRLSPESVAAQIEIERLEQQLDAARQAAKLAGVDHSDKIDAIAIELLNKRSAITHRESQALAADASLVNLRYAWIDANAKMTALQDDFAQRLRSDPQWRSAKSQLEQARTALASISK